MHKKGSIIFRLCFWHNYHISVSYLWPKGLNFFLSFSFFSRREQSNVKCCYEWVRYIAGRNCTVERLGSFTLCQKKLGIILAPHWWSFGRTVHLIRSMRPLCTVASTTCGKRSYVMNIRISFAEHNPLPKIRTPHPAIQMVSNITSLNDTLRGKA